MKIVWSALFVLSLLVWQTQPANAKAKEKDTKKVVVIIGASSGFGKGVALKLARKGDHLVLAARRTELLDQLATECGADALAVTTDISKPEQVERLADEAVKKFGHVDVWINDVGVGAIGRFEDIPMADHARLVDVNLKGIIFGSHVAMKLFDHQGYGTLINLGSIESELPIAYQASYAATKAAVRSLDHTLTQEIRLRRNKRIKVCTVMPWAVDTPWWGHCANYSGGTPRMSAMDGPDSVINAIVKVTEHPSSRELHVGWKAKASYYAHRAFPGLTERLAADISQKSQIETAPPTPSTSGALFEPMTTGTGIDGGVRARMKLEDERRHNN